MGAAKIELQENPNYHLIVLPDLSFKTVAREIEMQIKQWLVNPQEAHILDFSSVKTIDQSVLTLLLRFQTDLKKSGKKIFSINVNPVILKELKQRGIHSALHVVESMEDLKSEIEPKPAAKAGRVDASVLAPFVAGAAKAFEVQVKMKVVPGKIVSKSHVFEPGDAVCGRIKVEVAGFKGSVTLCLGEAVFKAVYKYILGEDITTIDKDSADAAGELINIIYGHAKTALNKTHGFQLKPVLPEILLHPAVEKVEGAVLCLPFTSDAGPIRLEIVIF